MFKSLTLALVLILSPLTAMAGTYWVSPNGEANWYNAQSDNPLSGSSCTTLKTANANAVAGDTIYLRGGVYRTNIAPKNSGKSTNSRIIYQAHKNETPIVSGDSLIGIWLDNDKYIKVSGITIKNVSRWALIVNGSDYAEISHCSFLPRAKSRGIEVWNNKGKPVRHLWFHHNIAHGMGSVYSDNGKCNDGGFIMQLGKYSYDYESNNSTWENNIFYHGGHHIFETYTMYNVVRNNVMYNDGFMPPNSSCSAKYSPGSDGLYGGRGAQIYDGKNRSGVYNLVEGGRYGHAGRPPDDDGANNLVITSRRNIIRYNNIFNAAANGLYFKVGYNSYGSDNRAYNNTIYFSGLKNSLEYNARRNIRLHNQSADNNFINNLLYKNGNGDISGGGTYTADNNWLTSDGDPEFINPDISKPSASHYAPDLRLKSSSAAIDNGIHLTTTISSGSNSKLLDVKDAMYFQDGSWGSSLSNIRPDWIAIGNIKNTVKISSIDYNSNRITLASPVNWKNNDKVWLYRKSDGSIVLNGNSPDIGANEYGISEAPSDTNYGPNSNFASEEINYDPNSNIAAEGTDGSASSGNLQIPDPPTDARIF
jgi:hypothetical protein